MAGNDAIRVEGNAFPSCIVSRRRFVAAGATACSALLAGCAGAGNAGAGASSSGPAGSSSAAESGAGSSSAGASADGASASGSAAQAASIPKSAREFDQISTTLFAFDTVVTIMASCSQDTLDALAERCQYFEQIFSRTIETSDIGRINAADGAPVEVAPETADIVQKALEYCRASEGRFDITVGAATSLWDFKEGIVPDKRALAEAVKHIDYTKVQVDGQTITLLDPQAKLDLGGIAKGYIADDLCQRLVEEGCDSGFVNLGGNVKTVGVKPDGRNWHVGIQDPNDVLDTVVAAIYAQPGGTSVVTSGLYERQFEQDGRKYWHILDPKTGYPAETDLVSATIVSGDSVDGDAFATPLFLMGRDAALAWIEAREGLEGLVVGMDGKIEQTAGCDAELF